MPTAEASSAPSTAFGKEIRESFFDFEEGWINLNHGSYGIAPKCVIAAGRAFQDSSNKAPDRFVKMEYTPKLNKIREKLSGLVGCDTSDLVILSNATSAVNVVLRARLGYEQNDKILFFQTTIYDACAASIQWIVDNNSHLNLTTVPIQVEYPISAKNLLELTERTIKEENEKGNGKIRLVLMDSISSMPGVILPVGDLVKLFRSYDILTLVDAAHHIGQLPINLRELKPDFWLSNCHKWLMGQRSVAVLYVSKPFQHLVSSLPIGNTYTKRSAPSILAEGTPAWINDFGWNGTIDWSNYLSLGEALEFRKRIGGETAINEYCHNLAVEGGLLVATILGTEIMENQPGEDTLIANMVNIRLPIDCADASTVEGRTDIALQKAFLYLTLMTDYKTQVPSFTHAGKWWIRFSAQVYNDLEEFRIVGESVKELCQRVRAGEYLQV